MYRPPHSPSAGFTLVEILLAVTIFAVVSSILFGSYSKTLDNVEATDRSIHGYAQAKACLERMTADLTSLAVTDKTTYKPPETSRSDNDPWRFEGLERDGAADMPRLKFSSRAHVDLAGDGREGVAEIVYSAEKDAGDRPGYVIRRRDTLMADLFEDKDRPAPILCDAVKSLRFLYYDADGNEADSWDSDSDGSGYATPRRVAIFLDIIGPGGPDGPPVHFETQVELPVYRDKPEGVS